MRGALLLHNFTGSPAMMGELTRAFLLEGFEVCAPLLPGHGAGEEALLASRWQDWELAVEAAYMKLSQRCSSIVAVGLSLGGALACVMAARHPTMDGLIAINPTVYPPAEPFMKRMRRLLDAGVDALPACRPDIVDQEVDAPEEVTPIAALLSIFDAVQKQPWSQIQCPLLLVTSAQDRVVAPSDSERLAAEVCGPVERLLLPRSGHIATLDRERNLLLDRVLDFTRRCSSLKKTVVIGS